MGADTKFHLSRVAFAELPCGMMVTTTNDPREHKVWLREDYGIDDTVFETLIRGYTKGDKVIFYKGSDFKPVEDNNRILILADSMGSLTEGKDIFDGVAIGNIGEEWKTMNVVRKCNNK